MHIVLRVQIVLSVPSGGIVYDQAQVLDRRHLRQLKYGNLHQGQAHFVAHPGCAKELGSLLVSAALFFLGCDM